MEIVTALLKGDVHLQEESTTRRCFTPLHQAAATGHLEAAAALIKAGADVQATTRRGFTPLHQAAVNWRLEVVAALLKAGADPEPMCSNGHTSLHVAYPYGSCSPRLLRLLVDAGVDTTLPVVAFKTPDGEVLSNETPLETTYRRLKENKIGGKDTTEWQIHKLEGVRRLLTCVGAVHAASWLWHNDVGATIVGRAPEISTMKTTVPTPLRMMLPTLRRRARKRGVLLRALFRWVVKLTLIMCRGSFLCFQWYDPCCSVLTLHGATLFAAHGVPGKISRASFAPPSCKLVAKLACCLAMLVWYQRPFAVLPALRSALCFMEGRDDVGHCFILSFFRQRFLNGPTFWSVIAYLSATWPKEALHSLTLQPATAVVRDACSHPEGAAKSLLMPGCVVAVERSSPCISPLQVVNRCINFCLLRLRFAESIMWLQKFRVRPPPVRQAGRSGQSLVYLGSGVTTYLYLGFLI